MSSSKTTLAVSLLAMLHARYRENSGRGIPVQWQLALRRRALLPALALQHACVRATVLAILVAVAAMMANEAGDAAPKRDRPASEAAAWLAPKLLALAFIVSAGVGVFEVGLALRGKQELGLTQYQVALTFTEGSPAGFVVQTMVFSPCRMGSWGSNIDGSELL